MVSFIGALGGIAGSLLALLGALAGGLLGGVGGALVALAVALVIALWFGPLSLLAVITSVLSGVVIGHGISETRREREYRAVRRQQASERTADERAAFGTPTSPHDWSVP